MQDIRINLLKKMQPITWDNKLINRFGANSDVKQALIQATPQAVKIAAPIAKYFKGSSDRQSLQNIHTFIRANLGYRRDPKGDQLIKMPNRFLLESGDCKSAALFCYSIAYNLGIPIYYKFANYSPLNGSTPSHVYTFGITKENNKFVSLDGTSSIFDYEKKPNFYVIANPMRVYQLSDNMEGIAGRNKAKRQQKHAANKAKRVQNRKVVKAHVKAKLKKVGSKIKSGLKKAGNLAKKGALVAPRGAFLALVRLNVKSIAFKLKKANQADLKSTWQNKAGGDFKSLQKAITAGAAKKPFLGISSDNGIEVIGAATVGATLATASPILIILAKFIGKITADKLDQANQNASDLQENFKNASQEVQEKAVQKVAESTGQTPDQVREFLSQTKQAYQQGASEGSGASGGNGESDQKAEKETPEESAPTGGGLMDKIKALPAPVKIGGIAAIAFVGYKVATGTKKKRK